jgi:hypothetical protein
MDDTLEELTALYEFSLRRLRNFRGDQPVMSEAVTHRLNETREPTDFATGNSPAEIAYRRGVSILRVTLLGYSFKTVSDVTEDEEAAIHAAYLFLNGPLLELAHEIDSESDSEPSHSTNKMVRDATRELQALLLDCNALPPNETHYRDAANFAA